jgi:hypothetical protein
MLVADLVSQDGDLKEAGIIWPLTWELADVIVSDLKSWIEGQVNIVELGAGTGVLSMELHARLQHYKQGITIATDLPHVVGLTRLNIEKCRSMYVEREIIAQPLAWGDLADIDQVLSRVRVDLLLLCEGCYWGGWDLLQSDTRSLLSTTFKQLKPRVIWIALTIRDLDREVGFILRLLDEWQAVWWRISRSQMSNFKMEMLSVGMGDKILLKLQRIS